MTLFIGSGGGGDNEMITQEDTIFVAGMNADASEEDIANHFGAIGLIKVKFKMHHLVNLYVNLIILFRFIQKDKKTMKPKIWLYRNKETGESKGEATVTYDDANAAKSAIDWFDGRDFNGATVRVSLAQRQNNWKQGGGGGFGRGGSFGGNRGGNNSNEIIKQNKNFMFSLIGGDRGGGRFDRDGGGRGGGDDGGRSRVTIIFINILYHC